MLREHLTQSNEDYLKAIYLLSAEHERATTNQIAKRMRVTPASVTGMIQKMASSEPPLVEYEKHRGVALTPEGVKIALEIIRHHRLLELFLQERLGYSWDEVHSEADRLEHVISEDLEERIAQELGDPERDPHGHPIPTRDFHLAPQSSLRLSELRAGQTASVQRVESEEPGLLRYLSSIGLTPRVHLQVLEYCSFDDNLRVQVQGQDGYVVLGPRVTGCIFVETL